MSVSPPSVLVRTTSETPNATTVIAGLLYSNLFVFIIDFFPVKSFLESFPIGSAITATHRHASTGDSPHCACAPNASSTPCAYALITSPADASATIARATCATDRDCAPSS